LEGVGESFLKRALRTTSEKGHWREELVERWGAWDKNNPVEWGKVWAETLGVKPCKNAAQGSKWPPRD